MTGETILITRPKGDEIALTEALQSLGYHVIHEPLQEIFLRHYERQALGKALMDEPDAVILTSRHGAQALALLTELRDLPLLCVGEATEQAAQSQGFTRTSTGGGNVQNLINIILDAYDPGSRFLYASGEQVRTDISAALIAEGMQAERFILYEAIASEQLSDTLTAQLRRGQIDAATFLSQRAARIFIDLLDRADLSPAMAPMQAFALGEAIAEPLESGDWRGIHISDEATLASLVECVDNAFTTSR